MTSSDRATGWALVAAQAALLITLALLPSRTDFALSDSLRTLADVLFWVGAALAVVAALSLGRSLTATPVPTASGTLRTNGPYAWVRHPIYTGVIVIVVAMAVRSGSLVAVAVAVVTLAFFNLKARWEERQLVAAYPAYPAYAAVTPRFIPSPRWTRRHPR